MQPKKELLQQLLQKVSPYRELGQGILLLLEQDLLEQDMIEYLLTFLRRVIKRLETKGDAATTLQSMYQEELEQKQKLWELRQKVVANVSDNADKITGNCNKKV